MSIYLSTQGTNVNKSIFKDLIKIGYFKKYGSVKKLLKTVEIIDYWKGSKWDGRKSISKNDIGLLGLENINIEKYATDKIKTGVGKQYKIFDWVGLTKELCNQIDNDEFESVILAKYQYDVLKYIDYIDSKLDWRFVCVTDLNTTYSPKFNAYCINNGKVTEMKIHKTIPRNDKECKTSYKQTPIEDGEIIYIKNCKKQPKKVKVGENWEIVPDTFEWWIKDYTVVVRNEKAGDI